MQQGLFPFLLFDLHQTLQSSSVIGLFFFSMTWQWPPNGWKIQREKTRGVISHAPLPSTKSSLLWFTWARSPSYLYSQVKSMFSNLRSTSLTPLVGWANMGFKGMPAASQRTHPWSNKERSQNRPFHTHKSNSGNSMQKYELRMCCIPSADSCISETPTSRTIFAYW